MIRKKNFIQKTATGRTPIAVRFVIRVRLVLFYDVL